MDVTTNIVVGVQCGVAMIRKSCVSGEHPVILYCKGMHLLTLALATCRALFWQHYHNKSTCLLNPRAADLRGKVISILRVQNIY